jgi:hypothetical protein
VPALCEEEAAAGEQAIEKERRLEKAQVKERPVGDVDGSGPRVIFGSVLLRVRLVGGQILVLDKCARLR